MNVDMETGHSKSSSCKQQLERTKTLSEDLHLAIFYISNEETSAVSRDSLTPCTWKYSIQKKLLDSYVKYVFHPTNTFLQEFRELRKSCTPHLATTVALLPHNATKNRSLEVLAADRYRCVLRPVADESSCRAASARDLIQRVKQEDYINATVVNSGFHEFIMTPHPLLSTVSDLWRMLVQCEPCAVVMFQEESADMSEFPRYWPMEGEQCTFLGRTSTPIVVTRQSPGPIHTPRTATLGGEELCTGEKKMQTSEDVEWAEKMWSEQGDEEELEQEEEEEAGTEECQMITEELNQDLQKKSTPSREKNVHKLRDESESLQGPSSRKRKLEERLRKSVKDEKDTRHTDGEKTKTEQTKYGMSLGHYHWRTRHEAMDVKTAQQHPYIFLSRLHVWVGGSRGGGRRRRIPHYHFSGGLRDEGAMLHLLQQVLYHQGITQRPIVVHCPNGADLCGVLAALARLVQYEVNSCDKATASEDEEKATVDEVERDLDGTISVYEAVRHVRQYLPRAVHRVESYEFLYKCMNVYVTSPSGRWGSWVTREPLPDHSLTALRPYSTTQLLRRIQRKYPDLLNESSRDLCLEETERGKNRCLGLFQEAMRRMEWERKERRKRRVEGMRRVK